MHMNPLPSSLAVTDELVFSCPYRADSFFEVTQAKAGLKPGFMFLTNRPEGAAECDAMPAVSGHLQAQA